MRSTLLSPDGAERTFGRFLALLADNRRLALLPEIAGLYEELRAEAERVVKATRHLGGGAAGRPNSTRIKAALKKRFGREVEIETAIDASLIGGAVIDAGDVVIDGSLQGQARPPAGRAGQLIRTFYLQRRRQRRHKGNHRWQPRSSTRPKSAN